jgi:DNA repair protein RecO (recombination protein O)
MMTVHYRTQGFVLAKQDRGEADRVFTIFTKDFGKLDLRAISERKITSKLRGGLELFYCSELEFIQGKFQKTLTNAALLNSYRHMRTDLLRLFLAHRMTEYFIKIVQGQEADKNIWQLLEKTFDALDDSRLSDEQVKLVPKTFQQHLLLCSGY